MNDLKIGFAQTNINPPLGIGIEGYYVPRYAKGFLDDMLLSAIALQSGGNTVIMISADHIGFSYLYPRYIAAVAEAAGIPNENVYLTCTHTHTGPFVRPGFGFEANPDLINNYADFVEARLRDVAVLAMNDLKPARMGYITGYAPERVAYIRLYKMKDGSTMTCPPVGDPNIDHPIGTLDQRVNVVRFDQENGQTVVLYNYGVHSDTIGGELVSPDFAGWVRRTIDKALDGAKAVFFPGCQGDVGSTNVFPKGGDMNDTEISFDNEMKSPGMARFVGRALAGTILQVFDKVHYVDVDSINILHKTVQVKSNMPTPEDDMERAALYNRLHDEGRDDEIPFQAMELTTVLAESNRLVRLKDGPESFELELTALKIGSIAFVGFPGEPFTDIGRQTKTAEGWDLILPCCITNGYKGYFPTPEAYAAGGYETRGSNYHCTVAETLISGAKELLEELKK